MVEEITHTPAIFPTISPIPYWKSTAPEPYSSDIDHIKEASWDYQTQNNYLWERHDVTNHMRFTLMKWVCKVCSKFKLLPETYYLSVNIIDRFLAMNYVEKEFLQLIGITAMHIAAKFEEVYSPSILEWVHMSANSCKKQQILDMERVILESIQYKLNVPTAIHFLEKLIKDSPENLQQFARKLLKNAMQQILALENRPSRMAKIVFDIATNTLQPAIISDTAHLLDMTHIAARTITSQT